MFFDIKIKLFGNKITKLDVFVYLTEVCWLSDVSDIPLFANEVILL